MLKKILLSFVLALLFSNVLFIDTSNVLIGDGGDNFEFLGFMHLAKENMLDGRSPFSHTDVLRYPHGFEYDHGADGFLTIVIGAVFNLFLGPVISYNITVVILLFLNILSCLVFFEKIADLNEIKNNKQVKIILASVVFGFSPYIFARINSHLNLSTILGIPVLMYSMVLMNNNIVQRSQNIKREDFLLVVISVILVGLGSLQYLILLFLVSPFLLAYIVINNNLKSYVWFLKNYTKDIMLSGLLLLLLFTMVWWGYVYAAL